MEGFIPSLLHTDPLLYFISDFVFFLRASDKLAKSGGHLIKYDCIFLLVAHFRDLTSIWVSVEFPSGPKRIEAGSRGHRECRRGSATGDHKAFFWASAATFLDEYGSHV